MSAITIQNVIDNNSTKDAQRILRKVIEAALANVDKSEAVTAAQFSTIVNGPAPASKKMASVTFNQILDRMTMDALIYTINLHAQEIAGLSDCPVAHMAWSFNRANEHADYRETWPFDHIDLPQVTSTEITAWLNVDPVAEPTPPASSHGVAFNDDMLNIANMAMDKATFGKVTNIATVLEELEELRNRPATTAVAPQPVQASGDIPDGKPVRMNAQDVFNLRDKLLDFDITAYDWDGINPLVPSIMQHFKFDVDALADLLWAREKNKNAWLVGHTGTGKSTLVEQVCAYTRTMFQRVNFDSDITRLEFVGKVDVTTDEDGNQVTTFTDGILPTAMQMPCVLMLDEADAIRGDIAYVLQPVLEGKSLRLLEDAGRMVHPHPEFTIVATANTAGSGDTTGMYSAAVKMQSAAAMNRYNVFINVDYMAVDDEMQVIKSMVPTLSKTIEQKLGSFITYYRNAIRIGEVTKPISPRNTITIAQYANDFEDRLGHAAAFQRALERNLFNAMDEGERAIAIGIADRNS